MSYCTNCGTQQSEGSKFCHNCGNQVLKDSSENLNITKPTVDKKIESQYIKLLTASVLSPEGDLKYGKIDLKGNWIIQPRFDSIDDGSEFQKDDLLIASLYGDVGCVDLEGNWIIQPNYIDIERCGNFFIVEIDNFQKGVIDKSANWILKPIFEDIRRMLSCDKWLVSVEDKWGAVDIRGNQVVNIVFESLNYFENINGDELASAKLKDKYGYINNTGEWVVSPIYDEAEQFNELGFAVVSIENKWGIIDVTGTFIINPIYEELHEDMGRNFAIARHNGKYGVIDLSNSWIIKPDFDELLDFDDQGLSPAKVNDKWGILDLQGKWIIEPKFDEIENSSISSRNLIRFNGDGEGAYMGWFDRKGYCAVEINKRNGFIDINGGWLIDPILDEHSLRLSWSEISRYDVNDRLIVRANGKFGLLDRLGKYVVDPEYYVLELTESGIYKASKNNKYGFIDYSGNWIIPPRFDYIFYDIWDLDDNEKKDWDPVLEAWVDCEEEVLDIDELIEEIKIEFTGIDGKIYLEEDIPITKLNAFLSSSLNDNELIDDIVENSIVYFDDTLWGKGDNGFLIFHLSQEIYVLINQFAQEPCIYNISTDIKLVNFSKEGVEITSFNNNENNLQTKNHFRNQQVFESLFNSINIILENRGSIKSEEGNSDDEDDFREEDIVDPLGLRENKRSGTDNDPLGLRD